MKSLNRAVRSITHPVITGNRDLRLYVALATGAAVVLALLLDVGNQLLFFTDWTTALRSWALTIVDSGVIAVLISLLIGRAQRDLHAAKRAVEELSRTDPLTGLPNRRAIMTEITARQGAVLMLVIVDIDRFKSINDTHGHRTGDAVICIVAQRLASDLAGADLVGRLGGEEFAVLALPEAMTRLLDELEQFRSRMAAAPLVVDGAAIRVTVSAGAAMSGPGEPFDTLYSEADAALYRAKNDGRNRTALSPRLQTMCARPSRRAVA